MNPPTFPRDVAIVGMSLRFPGAETVAEFWQNLCNGVESVTFFSDAELAATGVSAETLANPNFVKAVPRLRDVEHFDAGFFGFNPREAEFLDPQVRLFLECCWEALESAAIDPERAKRAISVFGGDNLNHYFMEHVIPSLNAQGAGANLFSVAMHNEKDAFATLVSHKLNLRGPSLTVQTYCSTSLVAVHLACQSLLAGESDVALAGGVSLTGLQVAGYFHEEGGIFSNDGHNRAFDASGKGTVFGNGAGVVVLKRLAEAQADGDTIYAVIKGSAVNNDGATKAGYSAPSAVGQTEAILLGLKAANVSPETISYFEAHGTATPIGDPIEVQAMTNAYRRFTALKQYCPIGSLKTNVGHLDRAAGVAGLIKTALVLKHGQVPPSLHFKTANPKIDFEGSPFYVNTKLAPLQARGGVKRAAVSSLGVGGTNAHAILEEAPKRERESEGEGESDGGWGSADERAVKVVVVSARSEAALEQAGVNLARFLNQNPEVSLADVAWTLQIGRRAFAHRRAVVCRDAGEVVRALETKDAKKVFGGVVTNPDQPVVFMFPGQGSQYVEMGRGLYEGEAVFRAEVERCAEILRGELGFDLREVLYPGGGDTDPAAHAASHGVAEKLKQTGVTQPALFVVEYALAMLWQSWGVEPAGMIGHSIGEYVAACLAGVFTLEDALRLVAARGRLMQSLAAGEMMAVPMAEVEVTAMLGSELSVAAVNGPNSCVVSGSAEAIEKLSAALAARGFEGRKLHTSHAFHSAMMEPILAEFEAAVRAVKRSAPKLKYVSNVTGTWITAEEATSPAYWAQHLRRAVRFADGVATLLGEGKMLALEVGPGRALSSFVRQHPVSASGPAAVTTLRHPQDKVDDREFLLSALARLWTAGVEIDWAGFGAGERRRRIPLPTYPFERRRYWVESHANRAAVGGAAAGAKGAGAAGGVGKKADLADWFYAPSWKRTSAPAAESGEGKNGAAPAWLVFADESAACAALIERVRAAGQRVNVVKAGEGFTASPMTDEFTIGAGARADYTRLLAELKGRGAMPARVAHFWSFGRQGGAAGKADRSESGPYLESQRRGFYSLLFLAQAIGEETLTQPVKIAVVTERLQALSGETVVAPERATLVGPCKVMPQEYPDIGCVNLDVAADGVEPAEWIRAELDGAVRDPVVAWRGGQRFVQSFDALRLEKPAAATPRLRERGVYLITGGLGGIGLTMAEFLAAQVKARLVLVQRTKLPEEATWDASLAEYDAGDALARKLKKVRELRAAGAEVLVVGADVTKFESMAAAVAEARARFGEIHGVMHGAGIAGDGIIQLKTPEVAAGVLDPKVKGTLVLERIFAEAPLDFLLLFSSVAAVVGGFGQVDYCGANSFLDAFASGQAGHARRLTASINWDAWAEVGMAVETVARPKLLEARQAASGVAEADADADGETRAIAHVHFQTLRVEGQVERYAGVFSPERNWYLREHRLFGVPTFPSTAYLELAYSVAARHAAGRTIELRDVFFFNPFSVPLGEERELELVLTPEGAEGGGVSEGAGGGVWGFVILSRAVEARDESGRKAPPTVSGLEWVEHCNGRVVLTAEAVRKTHDVAALAASCGEREILNDVSKYENDLTQVVRVGAHLELGSRWNHVRRMAFGADRQWVEQEMPAARAAEVSETGLHPAMMDFTALLPTQATAVYVPFSYGVVRSHAPLPAKIRTFVTNRDDPRSGKETVVFDAVLMDEHGRALVDIEGMTMRRIDQVKKEAFEAVKAKDAEMRAGLGTSTSTSKSTSTSGGGSEGGALSEGAGYRLGLKAPGVLSDLAIQSREREKPGAGMIEIEVCAAGLNFKDVLRALGMMGGSPDGDVAQGFGTECAGRVSAIGEGVTEVAVGDEVMAIAPASFAGYALTTAKMAVPISRGLTFEQAAGIPLVFLTAYHALVDQGRLAAGERVLIHAAAGGIGLAAIQIAQRIGAEIYATAGAAQKHEYLRGLGVEKIASSRSLAFADDVMTWSGGEGVDVVLNSLSGEFIGKSVGVLKPYGRFVEIGARDIYGNSQLGLRPFANNLSFAAVDLGPMFLQRADYVRGMFLKIAEHLATGAYRPLPVTVFPLARASEAFEYMAAAKQIGKIVLQVRAATRRVQTKPTGEGAAPVRHDLSEAILPGEGVEALKRILAGGLPQVVVTARALGQMIEGQKQTAKLIASATTAAASDPVAARVLHPRPALANGFEPARNDTEKALVKIWRQLLGIDEVGVHDNFFELGGDSLIGVQVLSRIKKDFAVQLPSSALYEGPTVAQFAEAVEAAKGAAV